MFWKYNNTVGWSYDLPFVLPSHARRVCHYLVCVYIYIYIYIYPSLFSIIGASKCICFQLDMHNGNLGFASIIYLFIYYLFFFCGRTIIWLPTTTLKIDSCGVMSKVIKDLSISFSSPIDFKVKWYNSLFDKWYQSHGHRFESRECHCEREIVGGTTI